jgi:nucleoside-diphosphate-sugar epimerase
MKVVLAGASGAIGTPLIRQLTAAGADAVLHELTALSKMPVRHSGMAATNALRERGSAHLVEAAGLVGAERFVTQSIVFGYGYGDHGGRPVTEEDPFGVPERGPTGQHVAAMRSAEEQAFAIGGVALRYGLFYGPGEPTRAFVDMLRKRLLPVVSGGGGLGNWIELDDAAAATVAALENGRPGTAYNVVDGTPVSWGDFLDEMARLVGAARPRRLPGWLVKLASPYAYSAMASSMRVSNERAVTELGWTPRYPSYREGLRRVATSG